MKMDTRENLAIVLAARPKGSPIPEDFRLEQRILPDLEKGEILVEVSYISIEPAMRGWMDDKPSYLPPVKLGEVMRASGTATVIKSENKEYEIGDTVLGRFGVQQYAVVNPKDVRRVDAELAPLLVHTGLLSTSGLTAYFGLLDIGKPKKGETVVISGAAGAVGSVVGQIARIKGCRVVGIAGGYDKCAKLKEEYGFDETIDYKSENIDAALKETCPDGVDVFFDNVGNPILDSVLKKINLRARIVVCGAVAQYNAGSNVSGPQNYLALVIKRARMEGLIVFDYESEYDMAIADLSEWWRDKKLIYDVDITEGVENFYKAFNKLFTGQNKGKSILQVK